MSLLYQSPSEAGLGFNPSDFYCTPENGVSCRNYHLVDRNDIRSVFADRSEPIAVAAEA